MQSNFKKHAPLAYSAFMAIPLYQAADIWINGLKSYSRQTREGWIIQQCTELGMRLFGQTYAYRGVSVCLTLFAALIGLLLYLGSKHSDKNY